MKPPSYDEYRSYIFKKSLYSTLQIISWYIIVLFLLSYASVLPKMLIENKSNYNLDDIYHELILTPLRETSKYIANMVPLKDSMLTALGALILTLFIHVRNENKEANEISGYYTSAARANKVFSDIIIISLAGVMFINFYSGVSDKLDHINSNTDKPEPWLLAFFIFFTLTFRSLEKDSIFFIKKQILQTQDRISKITTINGHFRNFIDSKNKSGRVYNYKHLRPLQDLQLSTFGYLKYDKIYIFLRSLILFLFLSCAIYCVVLIGDTISFLPRYPISPPEYSFQVFHHMHLNASKNFSLTCTLSIHTIISYTICNATYRLFYNQFKLYSNKDFEGFLLYSMILLFFIFGTFLFLMHPLLKSRPILSPGSYILQPMLEVVFWYIISLPLIPLIVIYFIIIYKLQKNYRQKLNNSLGLPIKQSLRKTNTSAELYYLNSKLESLQSLQKYMIEDRQNSHVEQNRSDVDSENIKISYE